MRKLILLKSEPLHSSHEATSREGTSKPVNLLGIIHPICWIFTIFLKLQILHIFKRLSVLRQRWASDVKLIFLLVELHCLYSSPFPSISRDNRLHYFGSRAGDCRLPFSSLHVWFIWISPDTGTIIEGSLDVTCEVIVVWSRGHRFEASSCGNIFLQKCRLRTILLWCDIFPDPECSASLAML